VPIVVSGVQQSFCWGPHVMARATTEKNSRLGVGVDTNIEASFPRQTLCPMAVRCGLPIYNSTVKALLEHGTARELSGIILWHTTGSNQKHDAYVLILLWTRCGV